MDSILILIGAVILAVWFERKNAAVSSAASGTSAASATVPAPAAQARNTPTQTVPPGVTVTAARTAMPAAGSFAEPTASQLSMSPATFTPFQSPLSSQAQQFLAGLPKPTSVVKSAPQTFYSQGNPYQGVTITAQFGPLNVQTEREALNIVIMQGYGPVSDSGGPGRWYVVGQIVGQPI